MSQVLTLALTKGRILQETLPLLAAAGIAPLEDIAKSRKLIFATTRDDVQMVILRGSDVPTYVRHGVADVGVVGKDVLLEQGADGLYEPLDLGIARCKLMTAGPAARPHKNAQRLTVATKFTAVARRYYAARGVQANIIKLYGAMELAPLMGLADEIVDIVDTGNTLKANGMVPYEEIANISSRLIVNKASMRARSSQINALLEAVSAALS
ncbi:MAG: ATP phosphoribosyltransferase [Gammaproteobacteria bacterium]|nr:MAG: ATP phosphoribosyltransferase [Gammaproteobacteria bacterium]